MPTATLPTLSEDQTDDLLYLARVGATSDLKAGIDVFAKSLSSTSSTLLSAAVDPNNGNGLLHMASANGHVETLKVLLSLSALSLNLQNASGNTPLHWAALNGHLDAVKILVEAGADVTVINGAGHDAVYAAEVNEKTEVAEWLLTAGKGLERGVSEGREEEAEPEAVAETEVEDVRQREGEVGDGQEVHNSGE